MLGCRITQLSAGPGGEDFEAGDDVGVFGGEVFRFRGIILHIKERKCGRRLRELAGFTATTNGLGLEVFVREVKLPCAAANRLEMIVPIEIQRVVR